MHNGASGEELQPAFPPPLPVVCFRAFLARLPPCTPETSSTPTAPVSRALEQVHGRGALGMPEFAFADRKVHNPPPRTTPRPGVVPPSAMISPLAVCGPRIAPALVSAAPKHETP